MILTLLGMIPGLATLASSILGAWFNAKVTITAARLGTDRDVAMGIVRQAGTEAHMRVEAMKVISSSRFLMALVAVFAVPLSVYYAKCVLWDTVLGLGTTEPLRGDVAAWSTQIIYFIFGAPAAMSIAQMWFSRPSGKTVAQED